MVRDQHTRAGIARQTGTGRTKKEIICFLKRAITRETFRYSPRRSRPPRPLASSRPARPRTSHSPLPRSASGLGPQPSPAPNDAFAGLPRLARCRLPQDATGMATASALIPAGWSSLQGVPAPSGQPNPVSRVSTHQGNAQEPFDCYQKTNQQQQSTTAAPTEPTIGPACHADNRPQIFHSPLTTSWRYVTIRLHAEDTFPTCEETFEPPYERAGFVTEPVSPCAVRVERAGQAGYG